jgi:hypothetical protein
MGLVGAIPTAPNGDTMAGQSRTSRARPYDGNLSLRHARIFIATFPCAAGAGLSRAEGIGYDAV